VVSVIHIPVSRNIGSPLKNKFKSNSKSLDFLRSFNINYKPNLIGIRYDARRQFGAIRPRNVGGGPYKIPETYDKYFVIDRVYNVRWDLTNHLILISRH
jgi:cell surface protein SprA